MCTRSAALQGFHEHGCLGTLPVLSGLVSKAFWLPAGQRGSDSYKCLCNSRKAPEWSTQAAVTTSKSPGIFLQPLNAQLFLWESVMLGEKSKWVQTSPPVSSAELFPQKFPVLVLAPISRGALGRGSSGSCLSLYLHVCRRQVAAPATHITLFPASCHFKQGHGVFDKQHQTGQVSFPKPLSLITTSEGFPAPSEHSLSPTCKNNFAFTFGA